MNDSVTPFIGYLHWIVSFKNTTMVIL